MRIFATLARMVFAGLILCCIRAAAQPALPVLPVQTNRTIAELTFLNVTNTVINTDTVGTNLTYTLQHPPSGATISANGIISWFPQEIQGPTSVILTTIAID